MTPQVWVAIVIGVAASIEDLARRQISNWICGAALLAGVVLHVASGGWRGGLSALLGSLVGLCVFLIFYLLGGMGGGDVKLMAGFGAVLGVKQLLEAALWTAACGGVFAAVAIGFSALMGLWRSKAQRAATGGSQPGEELSSTAGTAPLCASSRAPRPGMAVNRPLRSIPYAPAIAVGVWLSLVPKT